MTKDKILDTAERLFAEHGYAGTSLRNIVAQAGVNQAAVHYHFGSKEALFGTVVMRRAEPVNRERLALLEACEAQARPVLDQVLHAFLAPVFRMAAEPEGAVFVRLMVRVQSEGGMLPTIIRRHFGEVLERFSAVFGRALPDLPGEELFWRMWFAVGAMVHALRGEELRFVSDGVCDTSDPEATLARLVAFLSAGFRAGQEVE